MGYKVALDKAWKQVKDLTKEDKFEVKFLADTYSIDLASSKVFSLSCNTPAPEYIFILTLHYLMRQLQGLPEVTGKWVAFQELPGGQGYFGAFKKRAIDPIVRKYGDNPQAVVKCLDRLPGKKTQHGDAGIVLEVFDNLPVLITVFGKDEEFSVDANMHFDESIAKIFCTEDIAVLSDIVSRAI